MILGILLFIAFSGGVVALVKHANRPVKTGRGTRVGGKSGRGRGGSTTRPSWWLKAWNASGAPKTTETTLSGAAAVVTGKAAGRVGRGGAWVSRKLRRGGAWAARKTWHSMFFGEMPDTCGEQFIDSDGTVFTCDRKPWPHLRHRDAQTGARFVPFGNTKAFVSNPEPDTKPQAAPAPEPDDGLTWQERYRRDEQYKRYAELRRLAGTPLTAAQLVNELDVDRDVADELAKSWNERFQREHSTDNEIKPTAPPPVFIHPDRPTEGAHHVDTNTRPALNRAAVPPTLAHHLNFIAEFDPDDDAELLNMLGAEVQGALAYAEALGQMFENCVTGKGLDPAAMQGVNDYADAHTENAERVAAAHKQFLAVYEAVMEAAANGTQMPYNGRFFSGNAA